MAELLRSANITSQVPALVCVVFIAVLFVHAVDKLQTRFLAFLTSLEDRREKEEDRRAREDSVRNERFQKTLDASNVALGQVTDALNRSSNIIDGYDRRSLADRRGA